MVASQPEEINTTPPNRQESIPDEIFTATGIKEEDAIKAIPIVVEKQPAVKEEIKEIAKGIIVGLSPTQQVAYLLIKWIGIAIFIIIVAVVAYTFLTAPHLPSEVPLKADGSVDKDRIEALQTLSSLAFERMGDIIDLFVIRIMLPVFTTVLGYIFGRQAERRAQES